MDSGQRRRITQVRIRGGRIRCVVCGRAVAEILLPESDRPTCGACLAGPTPVERDAMTTGRSHRSEARPPAEPPTAARSLGPPRRDGRQPAGHPPLVTDGTEPTPDVEPHLLEQVGRLVPVEAATADHGVDQAGVGTDERLPSILVAPAAGHHEAGSAD